MTWGQEVYYILLHSEQAFALSLPNRGNPREAMFLKDGNFDSGIQLKMLFASSSGELENYVQFSGLEWLALAVLSLSCNNIVRPTGWYWWDDNAGLGTGTRQCFRCSLTGFGSTITFYICLFVYQIRKWVLNLKGQDQQGCLLMFCEQPDNAGVK